MQSGAIHREHNHDDRAARGFVVWIVTYAVLMICLFAFEGASGFLTDLVPDSLAGYQSPDS